MSVATSKETYTSNVIRSPFPDLVHIPEVSLSQFVFQDVNRFADKPAFIDGNTGQVYTFRDLYGNVKKFAYGLHLRGFKKGDVLALYSPNCIQFPVIFHGVSYLGGIITTVNPLYTADELCHQLQDASASIIVTATAFLDKALAASSKNPHIKEIITIDTYTGTQPPNVVISSYASIISPPAVLNDRPSYKKYLHDVEKLHSPAIDSTRDLVAIPYSSGTTGVPKGVMLTHYNLVANMLQVESTNSEADHTDTILGVLPFFHIYALELLVNYCVFKGVTVVVMPKFDLEQYLQLLEKYKATYLYLVPPIALGLAKSPLVDKYNLKSVRNIVSAAAPLAAEVEEALAKRLNLNVKQAYGMTEMSPVSHITPKGTVKRGSIGVLVANCVAKVVDLHDPKKTVKPGQEGELWVKGPNVMKGYLNRPDSTAHTIDHEGFLHTGDIAVVDEQGYFFIVDRVKELIKYKGFQVAPAELEGILLTHPAVADVAVIPKPDDEAGEIPKAFVVLKPGQKISENEISKFVEDKVSPHKKLRGGVQFIDAIPKSASGKILRRILVQQEREKAWAKNVPPPKSKL